MNNIIETTLRGIAKTIEGQRKQLETFFDIVKVGCEHRKVHSAVGEPDVYVCDAPYTHFGELCCMQNCPFINGDL